MPQIGNMSLNDIVIPPGFIPNPRRSPLTDPWEPIYWKQADDAIIIALRLARSHTNARGLIHGGLIAALADKAMGHSCGHRVGPRILARHSQSFGRLHRHREDRPMACRQEQRTQDRKHPLLRREHHHRR
jgi:hypothetical protein